MSFDYLNELIPNPVVISILNRFGNQERAMSDREYSILYEIVQKTNSNRILEFGAGVGISAYIMLSAKSEVFVTSVDLKPYSESGKVFSGLFKFDHHSSVQCSTEEFRNCNNGIWDLILVDANHEHDAAAADINWAAKHGTIVLAHDITQVGSCYISGICKNTAIDHNKQYTKINVGNGFGIIHE